MTLNNVYSQRELVNEGYEMNAGRYDIDSSAPNNYPNPLTVVGATNPLGPENGGYDANYYETMKPGAAYIQPSALPALPGEGAVPPAYSVNRDQLIARKADSCSKKRIFIIIIIFNIILLVIVSTSFGISVSNSVKVNTRVNLYQNCYQDVSSCRIGRSRNEYLYSCATPYKSINITVS